MRPYSIAALEPPSDRWAPWAYFTPTQPGYGVDAFTPEECDRWLTADAPARPGTVGHTAQLAPEVRSVAVQDLGPSLQHEWLYERLTAVARAVNAAWWDFELNHLDNIELLTYEEGGHYRPHVDWCAGHQTRKLSIVVMLTDPADYQGGQLLLSCGLGDGQAPVERGAVTVFPSWTLHAVTPVTAGVRRVGTCWVHGPAFR